MKKTAFILFSMAKVNNQDPWKLVSGNGANAIAQLYQTITEDETYIAPSEVLEYYKEWINLTRTEKIHYAQLSLQTIVK